VCYEVFCALIKEANIIFFKKNPIILSIHQKKVFLIGLDVLNNCCQLDKETAMP